jgi:anti-sigma B factor antagonist
VQLNKQIVNDAVVLELVGSLAGHKATTLFADAIEQAAQADSVVIVDLGRVSSIDLQGIGSLLRAHTVIRRLGGILRLARLTRRIFDLIVITRLVTVFDIFDSVDEAVAAQAQPTPSPLPRQSLVMIQRFLERA